MIKNKIIDEIQKTNCGISIEKFIDINLFDKFMVDDDEKLPETDFPFMCDLVPKWIVERGFNRYTLEKWGCAINTYNDLIIPVKDNDKRLVGWISRRLNANPFICITEGSLDTMWLDQHGFGSVALLGSSMSKKQKEMLYNISTQEFVICLDNDTTGLRAMNKIFKELSTSFIVSYITLPTGIKDVQDVRNQDQLCDIINKRNYW